MASHADSRSVALRQANAELAARALAGAEGIALHGPVHVYLQVASACNLDCYMCSEHNRPEHERHGRGLRSMPLDVFAKIERDLFPRSTRTVFGVGGEPTIAPHFAQFVRRAAAAGQEIHLVTNGTRFENAEVADVVARHVTDLFVSLDAATAPTYERIRRGARWDRTLRGLRSLRDLRARFAPSGSRLTLSFVLMKSNVRELPGFVELAHELGAAAVHAQHVIPVNEEGREESLHAEVELYAEARAAAERRAGELGIALEAPQPYAPPPVASASPAPQGNGCASIARGTPVPCTLPATSMSILYDGRVFPCCHPFAHQKMQIGDLRTQGAAEIWNSRTYRNLRAGMHTGDVPEICRNCSCVHDPPPGPEDPALILSSPDLAEYYGERDPAPLDAALSGPDRVGELLERAGWTAYLADLRRHASDLEAERRSLLAHVANLEAERPHLVAHVANLEAERPHLVAHAAECAAERWHLAGHAETLAAERRHLLAHVANLEAERPHLVAHAANLERELSDLRRRWTLRQRLALRLRRWLARLWPARRAPAARPQPIAAGRLTDEREA